MATPIITDTRRLAQRFWTRVTVTDDETQCWLWTGARGGKAHQGRPGKGHGTINLGTNRGNMLTHRLAFFFQHGWLPRYVLHECDNPPCCNPNHLKAARTLAENNADMRARGRHAYGEKVGGAKLTTQDVLDMRRRYGQPAPQRKRRAHSRVTFQALADEYRVDITTIHAAVRSENWKHLK